MILELQIGVHLTCALVHQSDERPMPQVQLFLHPRRHHIHMTDCPATAPYYTSQSTHQALCMAGTTLQLPKGKTVANKTRLLTPCVAA
jgi:hypothetical protein